MNRGNKRKYSIFNPAGEPSIKDSQFNTNRMPVENQVRPFRVPSKNVLVPPQGGVPADCTLEGDPAEHLKPFWMLMHAHKCQEIKCSVEECNTFKIVLDHVPKCLIGQICNVAHCKSSRLLMSHLKHCFHSDCPICVVLNFKSNDPDDTGVKVATRSPMPHSPNNTLLQSNQNTQLLVPHSQPQTTKNVLVPPQEGSADATQEVDPEKQLKILRILLMLLHAMLCKKYNNPPECQERRCHFEECNKFRNILDHLTKCLDDQNCDVAYCSMSKQLVSYYKLRKNAGCQYSGNLKLYCEVLDGLWNDTTQSTTGFVDILKSYFNIIHEINLFKSCGVSDNSSNNVLKSNQNTLLLVPHSQLQSTNTINTGPATSSVNDMLLPGSSIPPVTNISNSFTTTRTDIVTTQWNNVLQSSQSVPENHINDQEWRESFPLVIRADFVLMFVQAVCPTEDMDMYKDPKAILDKRMNSILTHAQKIEDDIYNVANSKSEYLQRAILTVYTITHLVENKTNVNELV